MSKIFAVLSLLLAGCSGMTDAEVRKEMAECRAIGGHPMPMQRLNGQVVRVRCW